MTDDLARANDNSRWADLRREQELRELAMRAGKTIDQILAPKRNKPDPASDAV